MTRLSAIALAACASLMATSVASANPAHLGASLKDVQAQYSDSSRIKLSTGETALELRDVDYGGVHWAKIDFVFNGSGRLASLQMHSNQIGFDEALDLANRQQSTREGVHDADSLGSGSADMQIRVCEGDGGEITFAYEPTTSIS